MRRVLWSLEIVLFLLLSFPLALLPERLSVKAGGILGLLLFHAWRRRRMIAIGNIERALRAGGLTIDESPEVIAKKSFMNLGRSFAETAKIYYGLGRGIIDGVEIKGLENYERAKSKGRGVILLTGHCGNWELMALTSGVKCDPISVVARAQDNPYLNSLLERVRRRFGNSVIYKKGALRGILSEMKKNGSVGILMDQAVIEEEGYKIDFLGMPAWTSRMPALIARRTGAAVIPAFIARKNGNHLITVYPEVALSGDENPEQALIEDTKSFSRFIEDYIKDHPTEWLWIHRRWKRA